MARIRTLKPEFWTDSVMVRLSPFARLLYIGTWTFSLCQQGHLADDPFGLKLKVLPADEVDPEALIEELVSTGRLLRKTTSDGRSYLHNPRLDVHQRIDPRWKPACPYCADENASSPTRTHASDAEARTQDAEAPRSARGLRLEAGVGIRTKDQKDQSQDHGARKRGTRLPDDFTITTDMIDWARKNTPLVGAKETEAFVDYWRGIPGTKGTKLDWPGTWRNWMRRAQSDAERRPNTSADRTRASPRPSTTDERMAQALAAGARVQAQLDQGAITA